MRPSPEDESWIRRCFDLATRGIGHVSPNPPVGAVLVESGELIGEGWHAFFGGPHAEVNAVASVAAADRHRIRGATLYVSLEPCCLSGKTPACTDLILREGISRVVVSTTDPNPSVAGNGLAILEKHGLAVRSGILAEEGSLLIRSFTVNILEDRPYITLKWAQSREGFYAPKDGRLWLSEPYTRTFTHRLRAEADAILAGAQTILEDDPGLTTRDYPGRSPARIVFDPNGRVPATSRVFAADGTRHFYISSQPAGTGIEPDVTRLEWGDTPDALEAMFRKLFRLGIGHILVEGGARVQKMIIDKALWDEAWVIRTGTSLPEGIPAPQVMGRCIRTFRTGQDEIVGIRRT